MGGANNQSLKKAAWFKQVQRAIIPMISHGECFDQILDSAPAWARNACNQLEKSFSRAYNIKDTDTNATKLGIMAGVLDSCSKIDFKGLTKRKTQSSDLSKALKMLPSAFKPIQKIQGTVALKFENIIRKQPIATQIEFHHAYERTISKKIHADNEPAFWETSATRIYIFLLLLSPWIHKVQSVDMLDKILSRPGNGLWVSSNPKRLQKLCQRIGLKFRKPGRPRLRAQHGQ